MKGLQPMAQSTGSAKVSVVVKAYGGEEADALLAQAEGYKRIVWEILNGNADRDPARFLGTCKRISGEQSEQGA
jgi:hypothetical protein